MEDNQKLKDLVLSEVDLLEAFQRRETNARRSSAGKRAAVHKAQFKVPGISGRTSPRLVKTV